MINWYIAKCHKMKSGCLGMIILMKSKLFDPLCCCCCSVAHLCLTLCNPMDCSMSGFSNSCPLSWWCHPIISLFGTPFSSNELALQSGGWSTGASASASVLPVNILVWFPCCPRDSQESSPALQFKSNNSLALTILYGPTLTSVHDYWKNHSFD